MSESIILYKLIILYMLNKVDFPLNNAQISDFILEKEYTSYFTIQQAISEMIDSELIRVETIRNSSYYHLTQEGENTLQFFGNKISDAIIEDIHEYIKNNKFQLRNEGSILADYYKTTNQDYAVRCQVKEKDSNLIDLTLTVPTKEQAEAICNNWNEESQNIYAYIIKQLMHN